MTLDDANKLLALAKANYSGAFKTMSKQEKVMLVQSWAFALQDIPADVVLIAFMQLLTTSKWLPTVAEIREQVKSLYYQSWPCDDRLYPDPETVKRAKEYISRHTCDLRGDGLPGLTLDTILRGPYMGALGSGSMEIMGIDSGKGNYLELLEAEAK